MYQPDVNYHGMLFHLTDSTKSNILPFIKPFKGNMLYLNPTLVINADMLHNYTIYEEPVLSIV